MANWQRATSPKRRRPPPRPISPLASRGIRMGGKHGRSNEEVLELLAKYRTGAFERSTDEGVADGP